MVWNSEVHPTASPHAKPRSTPATRSALEMVVAVFALPIADIFVENCGRTSRAFEYADTLVGVLKIEMNVAVAIILFSCAVHTFIGSFSSWKAILLVDSG